MNFIYTPKQSVFGKLSYAINHPKGYHQSLGKAVSFFLRTLLISVGKPPTAQRTSIGLHYSSKHSSYTHSQRLDLLTRRLKVSRVLRLGILVTAHPLVGESDLWSRFEGLVGHTIPRLS